MPDTPQLALSRAVVPRIDWVYETGSTNAELARRAVEDATLPEFAVLVTDRQTSGRGRLGREWIAPPGRTLAISVLLRPRLPGSATSQARAIGWVPLIAGLAMTEAVRGLGVRAELKWPNDVLATAEPGRAGKLCGVLGELLPDGSGLVIGAGLNLTLTEDELPVQTASSVVLAGGGEASADEALACYLRALIERYRAFIAANGDPGASGLHRAVTEACGTLGRQVRVELPSGERLLGVAAALTDSGHLVVESAGRRIEVAAGDVTHLRYGEAAPPDTNV